MATRYDAMIIGTGQAGPSLAVRLAGAGMRVAIAERGRFGGTCVNTGCIPTKTLVASARAAWMARRGADLGVVIDGRVTVDMKKVMARKDEVSRSSREGVEGWLRSTENLDVYEGHASFEDPRTIRVGDERLEAAKIFINVGARPFIPPIDGLEETDYLTSSSMMALESLPGHLVIIGGSYVGLEFAQMFRRFGSEVSVVEKGPRLIAREDDDISDVIKEILEGEGVQVHLRAECIGAAQEGTQVEVRLGGRTGETVLRGTHLLVAVGRSPNTHDLDLAQAGIETDSRGYIVVDDELRTNVPGIWALGDCNGRGAFTHTSYNDYEIVAANLLDDDPRRLGDRIPAYALYIDPPLGRAGASESEVRRSGRKALIAKRSMTRVARAVEKGETHGLMKILVDPATKEVLGAAILGVGGDEIVHSILDVMYAKASYTVIRRAMHIHPTVSELIPAMLGDLEPLQ